jgi:hypothetical protein
MSWGITLQIYSIGITSILGIVLLVMFALTLVRRWHAQQEHRAFIRWVTKSQYYIINAPRGGHSRRVRLDASPHPHTHDRAGWWPHTTGVAGAPHHQPFEETTHHPNLPRSIGRVKEGYRAYPSGYAHNV